MTLIEKIWFHHSVKYAALRYLMLPLTVVFAVLSYLRGWLYRCQILSSEHPGVPVIVVGNISVGGNGKTPMVVHIAKLLQSKGYKPGVLSRGYGAQCKDFPRSVTTSDSANVVGDEPTLMKQNLSCPLVIDPNRRRGARHLVNQHQVDVIICDDGLQHYALQRDVEIVVVDGQRRFGNGWLLPMGPLRELPSRLKRVDFVVANGGNNHGSETIMNLRAGLAVNINEPHKTLSFNALPQPIIALAAIGNPQRFFDLLEQQGVKLKQTLSFIDHHQFSRDELPDEPLIMTEKDAVKCRDIAHNNCWYLPVEAELSETFDTQLLSLLPHHLKETTPHGV